MNDWNNLFRYNLIKMGANNLTQANQNCLKLYISINIMSDNSNKSDGVAKGSPVKKKINITLCLSHYFC